MAVLSVRERASFEVAKRLLCQILNEGLVSGTLEISESEGSHLCLFRNDCVTEKPEKCIRVRLQPTAQAGIFMRSGRIVSLARPEMLQMPVTLVDGTSEGWEVRSGALFRFASGLFAENIKATTLEEIALELENSEANTGSRRLSSLFLSHK
jgi:hypothetical protein